MPQRGEVHQWLNSDRWCEWFEGGPQCFLGFSGGSDGKESACNEGDPSSIPGLRRSLEKGIGYPLQYSCLENSIPPGQRNLVGYSPWGRKGSDTTEQLTLTSSLLHRFYLQSSSCCARIKRSSSGLHSILGNTYFNCIHSSFCISQWSSTAY